MSQLPAMGSGTGPFMVVRIADPAIDQSPGKTDWGAYYRSRDPKLLSNIAGKQPVEFWCRPLTVSERREVRARRDAEGNSTAASREHAFRYGLTRVLRLVHRDGGTRDWMRPDDKSGRSHPIPDDAMEPFGDTTIEEVGAIIEARSFLDGDQQLVCPLLGISQGALTHLLLLRAGQTKDSSNSPLLKQGVAETATTLADMQPPSQAGAAPGVVIVMESLTSEVGR